MHVLQRFAEEAGLGVRPYSGRSMYGKECLGIEFDRNLGDVIADLLAGEITEDDRLELSKVFRSMRTDSMGRGGIVYFQEVPYVGDDEGADEEGGAL